LFCGPQLIFKLSLPVSVILLVSYENALASK
jgi:hypothetical protein